MWVLILVLSTSSGSQAGSAAVQQEFATAQHCNKAASVLVAQAEQRDNYVLTWGCFEKGVAK